MRWIIHLKIHLITKRNIMIISNSLIQRKFVKVTKQTPGSNVFCLTTAIYYKYKLLHGIGQSSKIQWAYLLHPEYRRVSRRKRQWAHLLHPEYQRVPCRRLIGDRRDYGFVFCTLRTGESPSGDSPGTETHLGQKAELRRHN